MAAGTDRVKVLNTWISMFGMRVLIALNEKGVEYEYVEEDLSNKSPLLLQSNPIHKKIPVLIHNGKPICESLIIVQYIDEAWPSHDSGPILPSDPYMRALGLFWADYANKIYDAGRRMIRSLEEDSKEQGRKDFKEIMVTLDGALRDVFGGGPYFGGEKIGLVDMTLAPLLSWLEACEKIGEVKVFDKELCPHLSQWAEVVGEQPSVKKAMSIAPSHKVFEFVEMRRKEAQAT